MTKNLPLAFYIDLNGPKINFDLNRKKQKLNSKRFKNTSNKNGFQQNTREVKKRKFLKRIYNRIEPNRFKH